MARAGRENCLGAHKFGENFDRFRFDWSRPRIGGDSGTFSSITASMGDINVDVDFDIPKISEIRFTSNVPNAIRNKLDDPEDPTPFTSNDSSSTPSLSTAAYSAIESTIQYAFSTPIVPDIEYGEGLEHLTPLDTKPDDPPVEYPVEQFIPLPPAPGVTPSDPPEIDFGERPDLTRPIVREYVPPELELFEVDTSGLESFEVPDVEELDWPEREEYEEDEGLRDKLEELLDGRGLIEEWINNVSQEKLVRADTRTVSRETAQTLEQLFIDAAARNLPLPSGHIDGQAIRIMDAELDKRFEISHAVQGEVFNAASDTIVTAVTSAVQIERYHFGLYLRYIRQYITTYKTNIALSQVIYNTLAELYNQMRQIVFAEVDAYSQYVQAQTEHISTQAMETQLVQARTDTLIAEVGLLKADADTMRVMARVQELDADQQTLPLDEYEITLRGSVANLDVVRHNISSYRQAIQNYTQVTDFLSDQISGYETAVQAESSKIAVDEGNIRNYIKLWDTEKQRMAGYRAYLQEVASVHQAEIGRFREAAASEQRYLSAVAQAVGQSVSKVGAYSSAVQHQGQVYGAFNSASVQQELGNDRADISQANLDMLEQALEAASQVANARVNAAKAGISARAGGALAQAASSIYNVSVSAMATASEASDGVDAYSDAVNVNERSAFSISCESEVRPTSI